jgi:hypothetical protein
VVKILEIWIFDNKGNIVFHQVNKGSDDPKRTAKINRYLYVTYGQNITLEENEMSSIEIDNFRLGILTYPSKNINFAGLVEQNVSQKKLSVDLKVLSEKFIETFYSDIQKNASQSSPAQSKETKTKVEAFLKDWIGVEIKQDQAKKILEML